VAQSRVATLRRVELQRARQRQRRRRVLVVLSVACAVVVTIAATLYGYVHFRFAQIKSVNVQGLHGVAAGKPFNLLVVGSDTRAGLQDAADFGGAAAPGGQRSDVILIIRVDPATHRAAMLSIPRDTVVEIAGGGRNKINAAFANGPSQLVKTIEQNFGIPINHYLLVNFDGFQSIVNAIGGIRMNFPYPARDAFSGLKVLTTGCVRLGGAQALALARSRHFMYEKNGRWVDADGFAPDIGRIRRQHIFLEQLARTAIAKGLTNPIRANAFIGAVVHDITKDSGLKISDVVRLAQLFRSFNPSAMPAYTLPTGNATDAALGSIQMIKLPDAQQVVNQFLGLPTSPSGGTAAAGNPATPGAAGTSVQVLNGTSRAGVARQSAAKLQAVGFHIGLVGDAPAPNSGATRLVYAPDAAAQGQAQALRARLLGPVQLQVDSTLPAGQVQIVIGAGFGGVRGAASTAAGSGGGQAAGQAKPPAAQAPSSLDVRPYDPRPC
jgi:LCP family protein required for cell wall assembly